MLTTKGQDQADKIVKHFEMIAFFDYVMGWRPGIEHKPSPEPLLKICEDLNIPPQRTIIIGDTELDIQCGKAAGAKTCAVTHGYRTKETLDLEEPDFMVNSLSEVPNKLNSRASKI